MSNFWWLRAHLFWKIWKKSLGSRWYGPKGLFNFGYSSSNCFTLNYYTEDYYCMYSPQVLNIIVPLAVEILKPCVVKHPKVEGIKKPTNDVASIRSKNSTFLLILDLGFNREVNKEYLVYDSINFIGSLCGTLAFFWGFSIFDFFVTIIDFCLDKCEKPKKSDMKMEERVKCLERNFEILCRSPSPHPNTDSTFLPVTSQHSIR